MSRALPKKNNIRGRDTRVRATCARNVKIRAGYTLDSRDSRGPGGLEPRRIWQRSITDMRACRSLSDPVDAWPIPVGNKTLVYPGRDISPRNAPFHFSTPRDPTYRGSTIRNSLFTVKRVARFSLPSYRMIVLRCDKSSPASVRRSTRGRNLTPIFSLSRKFF